MYVDPQTIASMNKSYFDDSMTSLSCSRYRANVLTCSIVVTIPTKVPVRKADKMMQFASWKSMAMFWD